MPFAEVDRLRRDQNPHPVGREDDREAPIARMISAIFAADVTPSRPDRDLAYSNLD